MFIQHCLYSLDYFLNTDRHRYTLVQYIVYSHTPSANTRSFCLDSMQFLKGTMSNFIKLTSLQLSLYFSTQLKVWPHGSGCQHHGSWWSQGCDDGCVFCLSREIKNCLHSFFFYLRVVAWTHLRANLALLLAFCYSCSRHLFISTAV